MIAFRLDGKGEAEAPGLHHREKLGRRIDGELLQVEPPHRLLGLSASDHEDTDAVFCFAGERVRQSVGHMKKNLDPDKPAASVQKSGVPPVS